MVKILYCVVLKCVGDVTNCWMDGWRRNAGSSRNISTVTALRVTFVLASVRQCLLGAELTGKCSSAIVCIQCTDGQCMALQRSVRRYNVLLRHNTIVCIQCTDGQCMALQRYIRRNNVMLRQDVHPVHRWTLHGAAALHAAV